MQEKVLELKMEDTVPSAYDPVAVHHLLKNGTRSEILQLLQQKIDLNCINEDGDTVVHSVLRNEKLIERHILEILTALLDQNVNPNIFNYREEMGLHLAIARRMKDTINFLLKFEANVNTTNKHGNSIAHFFIEDEYKKRKLIIRYPTMNTLENREMMEKDSIRFLEFLMSKDVDFDRQNKQGNSALHLAIMYQLLHILPTLLERTNDIKYIDKDNTTLLHLFLEGKSQSTNKHPDSSYDSKYAAKCLEILLDREVPIFASKDYSCNLISNAIKTGEKMDIIGPLINYYLNKCNDKNLATNLFYELLNTCTLWNEYDIDYFLTILCDLICKGINVNHELLVSKRFLLPERVAGNSMLFDFLKESGISYTIRSSYDKSLLHMLANQRNYQGSRDQLCNHVCDLIFCGNCDVNTTDERGKSVLQTAIGSGNFQIIPILIEFGADVNNRDYTMRTPLQDAVMTNEALDIVGLLLSKGADVNAADREGDTPLHLAACKNKVPVIKLLLENGALIDSRNKYRRTPLHVISWEWTGAEETMDLLLSNDADVNAKDQEGETPLHLAAFHSKVSAVRKLIEIGATVNCQNKDHETPLHHALALHALVEVVDLLLSSGADVNVANSTGETPLHLAVHQGSAVIVQKLLQLGAFVNCKNQYEKTPLHRAAINGDTKIVDLLLSKGADVSLEDHEGNTPLHLSVSHNNATIVKLFLDRGAPVNHRNEHEQTPLHRVRWHLPFAAEIVELLLKSGADVNVADSKGETPLHLAVHHGSAVIVQKLLQLGALVNCKNQYGTTPLHRAANSGDTEIVDLLLSEGADVSLEDHEGNTPLHLLVSHNNVAIVKLLLDRGAPVNHRNGHEQTPLHRVRWQSQEAAEIVELLLRSGADVNAKSALGEVALNCAFSERNVGLAMSLLRHGAAVDCVDEYWQTPLHRALTMNAPLEAIEALLTRGADANAKDCMGKTPLSEAIANNNLPSVRLLVERGARVNDRDDCRATPLHRALTMDVDLKIVELLLAKGADVNAKDREGNRPLHRLLHRWTLNDPEDIVKMLLEKGAYVNARNNVGESALYQALSLKNRALIDELLKHGADLNELNVRWFVLSSQCQLHQRILREYLVKLRAADLPFHGEYEVHADLAECREHRERCSREVARLRETFIGDGVSLWDFLHERSTIRGNHTSSDRLKQIVESPRLQMIFPEYSIVILASYHEAVTRIALLKAAQESLRELMQVELPNAVNILDYLTDEDLINTIEANVHDGTDDQ